MKRVEATAEINRLTQDEDERQELWIRYLEEGNDNVGAISSYLENIRKVFSEDELLQRTLWSRVYSNNSRDLSEVFEHFSDLEQMVMRLLALGATLTEISGITNICSNRLYHIISVIRKREVWKKLK